MSSIGSTVQKITSKICNYWTVSTIDQGSFLSIFFPHCYEWTIELFLLLREKQILKLTDFLRIKSFSLIHCVVRFSTQEIGWRFSFAIFSSRRSNVLNTTVCCQANTEHFCLTTNSGVCSAAPSWITNCRIKSSAYFLCWKPYHTVD